MFNLRLQPLATDNEGIIPESFEAESARERGVYVSVAEKFMVGNAHAPNCVRICVTGPNSRDHVKKGLEVIRDLLSGSPPKWPAAIL
jgi:DNA-binding transcriptional MocR family regulator